MARPKKNQEEQGFKYVARAMTHEESMNTLGATPLGDMLYKPKQLTGLNIVGTSEITKSIVNMNTLFHKILNVLIQNTHNAIYDNLEIYEGEDGLQYRKISLRKLIKKLGVSTSHVKQSNSYKDIRFIIDKTTDMVSLYIKLRNSKMIEAFPLFNNIKYIEEEECFYYSFNERIIKSITNNYVSLDCEDYSKGIQSYASFNMTEIHKKNLSLHSMMLYEFILCERMNVTINDKTFKLDEVFDYISNNKLWKPKRKIDEILIPAIYEIEKELGLKVYYYIKRAMTNKRIIGIKLKVFKTENYKDYENSKSDRNNFISLSDVKNVDIFKLDDLDLYIPEDTNYKPYRCISEKVEFETLLPEKLNNNVMDRIRFRFYDWEYYCRVCDKFGIEKEDENYYREMKSKNDEDLEILF